MQALVYRVQDYYDDDLNITKEEELKKNWFNNHKSKTIEDRKRTIEQILQKMLNHDLVRKNSEFILSELRIDSSFLKITEEIKNKRVSFNVSTDDK
jgi:hypothetical protein